MNAKQTFYAGMAAVMVLAVLVLGALGLSAPAGAAPAAAPTPVSVTASSKDAGEVVLYAGTVVTADGGSAVTVVKDYQLVDVQYVIDETAVNTTTVKLQFSNDNSNWTDGATLASSAVADGNGLTQQAVFGKFMRAYADVATTDPVTVTVIGILK